MYRDIYPAVGECVIALVVRVDQTTVYVTLPEYENKEGMILLTDWSRARGRNISKTVRLGKEIVCEVIRVDATRGYIDLNKKNVNGDKEEEIFEIYKKTKKVHSIVCHSAVVCELDPVNVYDMGIWDLYDMYGHALDAFEDAMNDPHSKAMQVFNDMDNEKLVNALFTNARKYLAPKPIKIVCDFECTYFGYAGVEGLKAALANGLHEAEKEIQKAPQRIEFDVTLVGTPRYRIVAQSKNGDRATIDNAISGFCTMVQKSLDGKGTFKIHTEAHAE